MICLIRNKRLVISCKTITTEFFSSEHNHKCDSFHSETTLLAISWRRRSVIAALIYSIIKSRVEFILQAIIAEYSNSKYATNIENKLIHYGFSVKGLL